MRESRTIAKVYGRFVDDMFTIFPSAEKSQNFLVLLNDLPLALKFTVENKYDGMLSFMDVLVQRVEDSFLELIFHKPTFTGLYTRWDSYVPTN